MQVRNKGTWIGLFSLIAIEQVIKIVISIHFFNERFSILPPFLYFEPMFNRRYSWFNSMLGFNNSKWIHISLVAIMCTLIFLFYLYINRQFGNIKIVSILFAFLFSGAVCSLIDKVFWDGSLDYILVNGFFTFDLKDVYINVFIGLLVFSVLFKNKVVNEKTLDAIANANIVKGFTKYLLRRL